MPSFSPATFLASTIAAATLAYAFKQSTQKPPKTELEQNSVPIPIPRTYLPFQIDSVLMYVLSTLAGADELELLRQISKDLGNTVNLKGLNQDFIIVTEPSSIQHILAKHQPNYEKGPEFKAIFHEFLGSGIFNADGDTWKTQRQLARPHFQTSEFKDAALINKHVGQLLKVLDKHIDSSPDTPVNVQNIFCRFTLDEASEFLFGETVNSLEKEHSVFSNAFNYAQSITAWRFRVPAWRLFVPKRKFLREIKVLDDFVYKIIDNAIARKDERLAEKAKGEKKDEEEEEEHATLLDHFLSYQKENEILSKTYLRDMLLNFLIAGRDTTASLLSFTMLHITQNPHVLERLHLEVDQVVGRDRVPGYDDVKKLKYQRQVLNEVLRLCPPVPFNMRQSVEEDVLPNGYYIPPKTPVCYSAYTTHRMTEYWGEDALEFDPDRWGPERVGSIKPFMFVPFHAGPRICLGQNLAYTTAHLTLTRLLQRYEIKAAPGFKADPFGDIVLFSRNGVEVVLRKRTPASEP